jgi:hypothetical protein
MGLRHGYNKKAQPKVAGRANAIERESFLLAKISSILFLQVRWIAFLCM